MEAETGIAQQQQERAVHYGRGEHPNTQAALVPGRIRKGETRNPGGRPIGPSMPVTILRLWYLTPQERAAYEPQTAMEEDVLAMMGKATGGNVRAFQTLVESAFGKPVQPLRADPPETGQDDLEAMLADAGLMLVPADAARLLDTAITDG